MALISQDYLDRLNAATDFESLVRQFVPDLKRAAGAELTGKCPFHKEKTPSFSINTQKNVYLCRGCGESGTPSKFLAKKTGMPFREAVERLARLASFPLPDEITDTKAAARHADQQEIFAVLDRAATLYRDALKDSPEARAYLAKRGVTTPAIERFGLGFAPAGGMLLRNNMKDVPLDLMQRAGLVCISEFNPGEAREWMNYRITFPIRNGSGRTIGFGGRSLSRNPQRKYINTTESPVFKKGSELYGMFEAGAEIRKRKSVIVTEGYLDVVVPSGHGVGNLVCAMGASLSAPAIARLFAAADHVIFCFDADAAGRRAAMRMLPILAPLIDERHRASFALLPEGMDPDDYVLKNGAPAFEEFIGKSVPMSKYLIGEYSSRHDMGSVEGKALFAAEVMEVIHQVRAPTYQSLLIEAVRGVVGPATPLPSNEAGVMLRAGDELEIEPKRGPYTVAQPAPSPRPSMRASSSAASDPKLVLSFVSIALRDPQAFRYFDPEWLRYVKLNDDEANAVRAIAAVAGDVQDGEQLLARLAGTPAEHYLRQAQQAPQVQCGVDPIGDLHDMIQFLVQRHQWALKTQRLWSAPKTPAPAP
jgi:DNA primase